MGYPFVSARQHRLSGGGIGDRAGVWSQC